MRAITYRERYASQFGAAATAEVSVTLKKVLIGLAILIVAYQAGMRGGVLPGAALDEGSVPTAASVPSAPAAATKGEGSPANSARASAIAEAYAHRRSNVQVESEGVVERVLRDDNEGSRHQRIIVRVPSGQTVLIAHNIDLAPRVESLREGDAISFSGEYEWNDRGGVVHWTHRDPGDRHVAGWIRHEGQLYQ